MNDSTSETNDHILRVRELLYIVQGKLEERGFAHDRSKTQSPEKEGFDEVTGALRGLTYGSDEYKAQLAKLKPILDHHYAHNSHHAEHYPLWKCPLCKSVFKEPETVASQCYEPPTRFCLKCCPNGSMFEAVLEPYLSVDGMTLLDLVEMFCDWKAATERHADGSIIKSIQHNKGRFHLSDQLVSILENTRLEMGW